MIFLTVGTLFPFDRLVRAIDEGVAKGLIKEDVFAQIGKDGFRPKNIEYTEVLKKDSFDSYVNKASCLISHAGVGSITIALSHRKPLLVVPRLKCFGEHVNNHQLHTAKKFEQLGCILAAYEKEDLLEKIKQLRSFVPKKRENDAQLVTARIADFLKEIRISKGQL
jgi:UDP-N-acetylglucosamine transferase subunit ALG13